MSNSTNECDFACDDDSEFYKEEYKLTIYPVLGMKQRISFTFKFYDEMIAAKGATIDLLLFVQDELKVMEDHSNMFITEKRINDGEWEEIEV